MKTLVERLETPIREETDVLVVGGIAGVAAALAARRAGARVLLMEKQALLGGLATNGLISWYEPLCDGQGRQLIYGLAEELLRLSFRYGDDSLPEIWKDRSVPVDPAMVRPEKQHPVTMVGFGRLFMAKAPKNINMLFGYRTAMSMKNRDT